MNEKDEKRARGDVEEKMRHAAMKKMLNRRFLVTVAVIFSFAMFVDEILPVYSALTPANTMAGVVAISRGFFGSLGLITVIVWLYFNIALADVA